MANLHTGPAHSGNPRAPAAKTASADLQVSELFQLTLDALGLVTFALALGLGITVIRVRFRVREGQAASLARQFPPELRKSSMIG